MNEASERTLKTSSFTILHACALGAFGALLVGLGEAAWLARLGSLSQGSWWFSVWIHLLVGAGIGLGVGSGALLGGRD